MREGTIAHPDQQLALYQWGSRVMEDLLLTDQGHQTKSFDT
ncbi:hypothetical protein SPLC1_S532110 [Arthrospira platensis C1]|nr:hypothetical protein SPLC1_S532110 [Arthrospira platensis C1]